ncbi:MAG: maleylacetoacetate isomerase [Pseudomonadota bacterium]
MKLYSYFRSSTSYRVRVALNLKGLSYQTLPVDLLAGEQAGDVYTQINAFNAVPTLEMDGATYVQSLAIIDALEDKYPEPSLYPSKPALLQACRELSFAIASEIHALNNLRVLKYLRRQLGLEQGQIAQWYATWVRRTLIPVEARLEAMWSDTILPFGDAPSLFEIVLIPQLYNARRFDVDLSDLPTLLRVEEHCLAISAFKKAHPDQQPDAPKDQ